jgi:hypothetical protein
MAAIAPALPYILAGVGTAASIASASEASSERKKSINRMMGIQEEEQAGMTKIGAQQGAQYDPAVREPAAAAVQQQQQTGIDKAIADAQAAAPTEGATGRVSDAYGRAVGTSNVTGAARNKQLSDLLSRVMTPGELQLQEGIKSARLGTKARILGTDTGAAIGSERSRYSAIEPNPILAYGGPLLTAAGGAVAQQQAASKINDVYGRLFEPNASIRPAPTVTVGTASYPKDWR